MFSLAKKFIRKNHVEIVVLSSFITLIGFGLAIAAEVMSQEMDKDDVQKRIDTFGFSGIILLFVGFLVTSVSQTIAIM